METSSVRESDQDLGVFLVFNYPLLNCLKEAILSLLCVVLLWTRAAAAIFFHENSSIVITPTDGRNDSSFGFSLGYQGGENASLVIGAPLYDKIGRVFQGSIQNFLRGNTACESVDIDFKALHIYNSRKLSPNQHFHLGASIAATDKIFVTCAPLRTAHGKYFKSNTDKFGAFGACFVYDRTTARAHACKNYGLEFLLRNWISVKDYTYGPSGWSSMIDEKRNKIIISKSFNTPDLSYSTLDVNKYRYLSFTPGLEIAKNITCFGKAMTFGNYFDLDQNKTYYVFSFRYMSGKGGVDFYPSDNTWKPIWRLEDRTVGSMFGSALCSADISRDGLSELIVGAPAQVSDTRSTDRGAVHIYTKSKSGKAQMELQLSIWGVLDGGRFGTTLSTNDVDGDSFPEILVSSPFEKIENGVGALYVLCGHEIQNLKATQILVSDLRRSQKIEKETHTLFGFSLQPVSDFNENGSDELGVGAPGNSRVTLFPGVRAITVNVTSKFSGASLDPDSGFSKVHFSSCVTVHLPIKPTIITTKLLVKNVISGKGSFNNSDEAVYEIDLSSAKLNPKASSLTEYCRNITIVDGLLFIVNTTVSSIGNIQEHKDFNETWVTLSALSELTKCNLFECVCPESGCAPELGVKLRWSGSNYTHAVTEYLIGSSNFETLKVSVQNSGTKGCRSCAVVTVRGDLDHQLPCQRDHNDVRYKCPLDSFMENTTKTIDIQLVMGRLSNQESNFTIDVEVRQDCNEPGHLTSLTVPYNFTKVLGNVIIDGTNINREIADTELQDESEDTIYYEQTYIIANDQSFVWKNVLINLTATNTPFIQSFRAAIKQTGKFVEYNGTEDFSWTSVLNLAPYSISKLSISTTILKKEIASCLQNGNVTIPSELVLELLPGTTRTKMLTTVLTFKKELTFWHNKTLITMMALLVALLVLLVITVILYKLNFFRRKNKEKLKREIRRRSIRRESSRRHAPPEASGAAEQPFETVDLLAPKEESCHKQDAGPSSDARKENN